MSIMDDARGSLVDPRSFPDPTTQQLRGLKRDLPSAEMVAEVIANNPFKDFRYNDQSFNEDDAVELVNAFLGRIFATHEETLGGDFTRDMGDDEIRTLLESANAVHAALGMTLQMTAMSNAAAEYMSGRKVMNFLRKQDLFRQGTFLPFRWLPDLFMATPVWYVVKSTDTKREGINTTTQPTIRYFCDLLGNSNWAHLFQLFNNSVRSLSAKYKGEPIPEEVGDLILQAQDIFDYVVVATPHHDVVTADWDRMEWKRIVDPYVIGFKKNFPCAFILARFSGSGIFPLYREMVADTIHFLRSAPTILEKHAKKVVYLYDPSAKSDKSSNGSYLTDHIRKTLAAFDSGNLFDWLRGVEKSQT